MSSFAAFDPHGSRPARPMNAAMRRAMQEYAQAQDDSFKAKPAKQPQPQRPTQLTPPTTGYTPAARAAEFDLIPNTRYAVPGKSAREATHAAYKRLREDFVKFVAKNYAAEILAAGFSQKTLADMRQGIRPPELGIHHVLPKHGGGTNDFDNLVFLTKSVHAALHTELDKQIPPHFFRVFDSYSTTPPHLITMVRLPRPKMHFDVTAADLAYERRQQRLRAPQPSNGANKPPTP